MSDAMEGYPKGVNTNSRPSELKPGSINDSLYVDLVTDLIQDQTIDFIFEEATGLGPTTAEGLSAKLVGANRYLDVDPPTQKRQIFGIPSETNKSVMLGSPMSNPPNLGWANWRPIRVHEAREKLWLERMRDQAFNRALMICGIAHMLSLAFRLQDAALK